MGVIKSFKVKKGSTTYDLDDFVEILPTAYNSKNVVPPNNFFKCNKEISSGSYNEFGQLVIPELAADKYIPMCSSSTTPECLKTDAFDGKLSIIKNGIKTTTPCVRKGYGTMCRELCSLGPGTYSLKRTTNGEIKIYNGSTVVSTLSTAAQNRHFFVIALCSSGGSGGGGGSDVGSNAGSGGGGGGGAIATIEFKDQQPCELTLSLGGAGGGVGGNTNGHDGGACTISYSPAGTLIRITGGEGGNHGNHGNQSGGYGGYLNVYRPTYSNSAISWAVITSQNGARGATQGNGSGTGTVSFGNLFISEGHGFTSIGGYSGGGHGDGSDSGGGGASPFGGGVGGRGNGTAGGTGGGGGGGKWVAFGAGSSDNSKSGNNGKIAFYY